MNLTQAVTLGAVQGITEFLPVSSTAHLILVPWFLGWPDPGAAFDVALHLGTLMALLLYFRNDWLGLLTSGIGWLRGNRSDPTGRLAAYIVFATIPGALIGALFEKQVETVFRSPLIISIALISLALVLAYAERVGRRTKDLDHISLGDGLTVGFAQALALIPGVSRSGVTITAGLFRGMTRPAAARFSFFLSTPIIAGAVAKKFIDIAREGLPVGESVPFVAGIVVSGIIGYLAIAFLIRYLSTHNTYVFIYYRIALGIIVFLAFLGDFARIGPELSAISGTSPSMSRSVLGYFAPTEHRRLNESVGLLLAVIAILIGLSLVSFTPNDPSFNISRSPLFDAKPANFIGFVGAYLADAFFQTFGFSSFLIPVFLGVYAFYWLASWPVRAPGARMLGLTLMILTLSASLSWSPSFPRIRGELPAGGVVGHIVADRMDGLVNPAGSAVILIAGFLASLFLTTTFSFAWVTGILKPRFRFVSAWIESYNKWQDERKLEDARRKSEERKAPKKQMIAQSKERIREPEKPAATIAAPEPPRVLKPASIVSHGMPPVAAAVRAPVPEPKAATRAAKTGDEILAGLPSTTLLNIPVALSPINEEELRHRASTVEQKCREFEVDGTVQHIHPGPVVTTFEFKPEPGIKYSKITGLGDDLCLALEAESVRIDRMPGKSTVGIEVPNDKRATIVLRELLESAEYTNSSFRLPLALGKDITGKIVVTDLQKMPHLLTAGSTGTGKSVSINAMILSLLYHSRPDQMKMILIDPKRLELGLYQDIPHLLVPVVTEPRIAQNALRWAVVEMETRYKKLAKRGVRNLDAYNEQIRQLPLPGLDMEPVDVLSDREPLPYIVIVIDELADLMMTAAREVEEYITRLAQMARAVGIHLILATQRPSVDVITGLIKANFPARVSFRVASKTDSRTILDSNGAEQLLGRGDMLFLPPGSSRLMRVHGPLITEDEVSKVVAYLKTQGKPIYNERILEEPEESHDTGSTDGELDELYTDAVNVVLEMGKASTSALQRRLRVGYGRAASLIDGMERAGIVGPPDGSKPRAVLIKREDFFTDS